MKLAALLCASLLFAQEPASDLTAKLAELDAANPERARALASELGAGGDEVAVVALASTPEAFAALPLDARRARSQVASDGGGSRTIAVALRRLDDPDDGVRRNLMALVADPERRHTDMAPRIGALERLALRDPNAELRGIAIRGLARLDSVEACAALERCLLAAAARESIQCAQVLAIQPRAREIVVRLVQRAFAPEVGARAIDLPAEALEALLENGYGNALAETPSGGASERDRAPFVHGAHHPAPGVRRAAALALQRYLDRAQGLGDWRRADAALAALGDRGLDDFELLVERVRLALQASDDSGIARACAAEIRRRWPLDAELDNRERAASGALLEAVAALAASDAGAVEPALAAAADSLDSLRAEQLTARVDGGSNNDNREHAHRRDALMVSAQAQLRAIVLRGVVETYRVLALLASGRDAADGGVLARARQADLLLLEAQCVAATARSDVRLSLDELLTQRFGPAALLFGNRRSAGLTASRALELEIALAKVFATVTGGVPGFAPAQGVEERLSSRLGDDARRGWLNRIQLTRFQTDELGLDLRKEELDNTPASDLDEHRELMRLRQLVKFAHQRESDEGEPALLRQLEPSRAGLSLVDRLREQGRVEQALALAQKVRDDFDAARESFYSFVDAARVLARAETKLGSARMDANSPVEAEEAFNAALARLDAIEKDPALRGSERELANVRAQSADVLVSMAVNANVKLRKPDKALQYFERAYAIQQSDFMRVLLACYRARAGRAAEAREALRDVPISPTNYYNLGCTYALLGERELALDFLRRDLDELRGSGGARERQKEWARGDPDLESLRTDPRFVALMRPAEKGQGE